MHGIYWMKYRVDYIPSFAKDFKKLSKRYKTLKQDYKRLIEVLENCSNPKELGKTLGKDCYKMRLKNSDNHKGKSAGYRVIYFYVDSDFTITLLSIYSKSDIANIDESEIDKRVSEKLAKL